MDRSELFKHLVAMAAVDGEITDDELEFLAARAAKWGLSETEIQTALDVITSSKPNFSLPPTKIQRVELLREMIRMMVVDGSIDPAERRLCAAAAVAMDISPTEFKDVLSSFT